MLVNIARILWFPRNEGNDGYAYGDVTFDTEKIWNIETARSLTPVEYVQQILVPEAALLLIRDDLLKKNGSVDWDEAYQTLQKSSEFGNCMYLDDTAE